MNDTLAFFGFATTPLELVSFALAATTVLLNIRQNHWAWLFSIASSATYAVVFFDARLYGDSGLQLVFIAASVWGWWQWLRGAGETFSAGIDLGLLVSALESGRMVTTGDQVTARDFLSQLPVLGEADVYDQVIDRMTATDDGERAGAIELALEGLYLARKIGKESGGGETVYG